MKTIKLILSCCLIPLSLFGQEFDYGGAEVQNELINIDYLHEKGYTGEGVTIGVLDAGFAGTDTLYAFDHFRDENKLLNTYDFIADSNDVFHTHAHGTFVLSIMAAYDPGQFVGVAPDANYMIAMTDDVASETPEDEENFVRGLEWADSLEADILSASLGYYEFDRGYEDYTYDDLDGETSLAVNAADEAAGDGLLVITSAGNGGNILTPCDGDSVLCVGGSDFEMDYDDSSSTGPTVDERIKPDIAALSINVNGYWSWGYHEFNRYSGTSYATPFISGLAACLKEAHPWASNAQLMKAIKQSGHQAQNPDTLLGHGVPNARVADSLLTKWQSSSKSSINSKPGFSAFPNPFKTQLTIEGKRQADIQKIEVLSMLGKKQKVKKLGHANNIQLNTTHWSPGQYILKVTGKNGLQHTLRVLKR